MRFMQYVAMVIWWKACYVVRPYDMLADRRRWFWQSAQQCGWPDEWER